MDEKISLSQNLLKEKSRLKKWTPVTVAEMHGFLAVILNMLLQILERIGVPPGLAKFRSLGNFFQKIVLR